MPAVETGPKNKVHKTDKRPLPKVGPESQEMAHESPQPSAILDKLASPTPPPINPEEILSLQRTVGNRTVQRLVSGPGLERVAGRFRQANQTLEVLQRNPDLTEAERRALEQMATDLNSLNQSLGRLNTVLQRGEDVVGHLGREEDQAIIRATRQRVQSVRTRAQQVGAIADIARDAANLDAALERLQRTEGDPDAMHAVGVRLSAFGQTLSGHTGFFDRSGINFLSRYVTAVIRGATACGAAGIRVFEAYHRRVSGAMMGEQTARGVDRSIMPVMVTGRVHGLDLQARRDLRVILNNVRAIDQRGQRTLMTPSYYRRMFSVNDDGTFVIRVQTEVPTGMRRMEGDVLYIVLYGTSETDTIDLVRVGGALHGEAPEVVLEG